MYLLQPMEYHILHLYLQQLVVVVVADLVHHDLQVDIHQNKDGQAVLAVLEPWVLVEMVAQEDITQVVTQLRRNRDKQVLLLLDLEQVAEEQAEVFIYLQKA